MLVTLAGTLIAILPVLVAYALWRLMRMLWRLLRQPRMRFGVLVARAGRLRRRRSSTAVSGEGPDPAVMAEEVARLRAELRVARAELAVLEAARPGTGVRWPWRRPVDDRFHQAKLAFARAFHPDRLPEGAADSAIRAAVFKEFWDVLRRIERA